MGVIHWVSDHYENFKGFHGITTRITLYGILSLSANVSERIATMLLPRVEGDAWVSKSLRNRQDMLMHTGIISLACARLQ